MEIVFFIVTGLINVSLLTYSYFCTPFLGSGMGESKFQWLVKRNKEYDSYKLQLQKEIYVL